MVIPRADKPCLGRGSALVIVTARRAFSTRTRNNNPLSRKIPKAVVRSASAFDFLVPARSTDASISNKKTASIGRPQTGLGRIRHFPEGVKELFHDCRRYKNIHDASKTDKVRPGRIRRRQYEQQRQLRNDFRTMLPLVIIWIPPIIGFLPPILAMVAPRQVMSRHFHNPYEITSYAQIEYRQRKEVYIELGDMFWCSFQAPTSTLNAVAFSKGGPGDAGGPFFVDAAAIYYTAFADDRRPNPASKIPPGIFSALDDLPREYLVSSAFQQMPSLR
jgi:hypothetical protein